jgi:pyruvate dehydrogenase E2 component (dihydrolipoamide acetyltransferase)
MTTPILMPALSPTMTEGTITKWHKVEGDEVTAGDLLAEIETDKATMELEAVEEGILGTILKPESSEGIPVNEPIAIMLTDGEDASNLNTYVESYPPELGEENQASADLVQPQMLPKPGSDSNKPKVDASLRIFASPLARRAASDAGIDLTNIAGSGPHGRVVKRDLEAIPSKTPQEDGTVIGQSEISVPAVVSSKKMVPAPLKSTPGENFTEIIHSNMRMVIADRLTKSSNEIPHFFLTIECEIERLLEMRKDLNNRAPEGEGFFKLSVNDFVVRAVALAIKKVPMVNVSWTDKAMRQLNNVDISIAVATEGGLITPIIRNADRKGLTEISIETKVLANKARDGKLTPEEYQGGSFTISNLGMYGVKEFSAIINQPQSCILAVGAGEKRAVVKKDTLSIATMMSCTLSVDHRTVDGALGAQYLQAFKSLIEDPLTMIL